MSFVRSDKPGLQQKRFFCVPFLLLLLTSLVTLVVAGCGGGSSGSSPSKQLPVANAGGPYSSTVGQVITFSGSGSSAPSGQTLSYAWSFGDGGSGTGVAPTHTYTTSGSYTARLTVTDTSGDQASASAAVTIVANTTADAGGPYSGTIGQAVTFDGSKSTGPSGQTLTYAWTFGDGGTGTGVSPTHTYTAAGSYTVSLTVTDGAGGSSTASAQATISLPATANAGGPYMGTVGQPIAFDGSKSTASSGQTLTYAWSFGDGGTGTGVTPTHTYIATGTYTVSLTVTDTAGSTSTATATATVIAAPVANAGGPYVGTVAQPIAFDGSKSTVPSGQTLTYAWSFGDGASGTGIAPAHAYTAKGSYNVTLTVTDGIGASNTASAAVTIVDNTGANAGGPYTGVIGVAVGFNGTASTGPAGQALTYAWTFGDGGTGTGASPTHVYTTANTFNVSLTVTDSAGGSSSSTTTAVITSGVAASAGGPYTGAIGVAVSFSGAASTGPAGQALTYAWNFGDGNTGTGVGPTHAYATAGTFTVSLTVTDATGGAASTTTTATISNGIVASAGGPYTGAVGVAVSFSGAASTGPGGQTLGYAWDFGDGSTGTGVSPTHVYTAIGTFNVSLTVSDTGGGSASATATATITSGIVASVGGPYSGVAGTAISFNAAASTGPSGQTLTYNWDFGDGSTGTGVSTTHTYTTAGTYTVSLTVTDAVGGSATTTAKVTIGMGISPSAGGPYTGKVNQAITFDGSKSMGPSGQTLTYAWDFGDGGTGSGVAPTHSYASSGTFTVTVTVSDSAGASASASTTATIGTAAIAPPTISSFTPASGTVGTLITVTGTNFTATGGPAPIVTLAAPGGGTVNAPVSSYNATNLMFVVPAGAATGSFTITVGTQSVTSTGSLTVPASTTFTVGASPATASLIPGQSAAIAVTLTSTNSFAGTATLAVTNLPSGVTASFKPTAIAAGQTSTLTLSAPASQAASSTSLTITGSATVNGQTASQSASATLKVTAVTTSFLGRTVVDDAQEEPLAGVTVQFLGKDDKGNSTGCAAQTVTSDAGGNFQMTNLPTACTGPQLISYNGATATAPAGKYAGVNLSYTLVAGKAVASPVLVHLPRIDNAETVQVQQNAPNDQVFYFHSIPGLKAIVYAGTTLSLDDGSKPNPFPLVAISIPIDRLPDMLPTTGMLSPFIVAFQPANAVASQPVAVNFPNSLGTAPGTHVTFVTLDPTHGYMVPYGTGTVSADGTEFTADPDPNHAGHQYGLVHFDWHGPMPGPPNDINPGQACGCDSPGSTPTEAKPVDLSSGIVYYTNTDLSVGSARGSIGIHRYYRTLSTTMGPFGLGTAFDYDYSLNVLSYIDGGSTITLAMPDGNQYLMSVQPNGGFVNAIIPALRGSVLTTAGNSGPYTLTWLDGTTYTFSVNTATGQAGAFLTSITDLNGNTTTITRNPSNPQQIQSITDPVGRSIVLTYNGNGLVQKATDPIGRSVSYTYNSGSTLATFTDTNGGVTKYTYDSTNSLATVTDPRGVVTEQNTYQSFDGRVTQQVESDGGTYKFAYTLLNAGVKTSPVQQTVVTDPLGNQTTYRFNPQSFLVSATDATGQTRTLTRDPAHSNLVTAYTGFGVCPVCGDVSAGNVSYTFDQFGNMLSQTDALNNTTTFTYDTRFNKINSITDALHHTTKVAYDAKGNATSVTDANGNTAQMAYDGFGELTQVTDPMGNKTQIAYDGYGNVTSVTDALGHATQLTYDAVSRLTQALDALGRRSSMAYDPLNRVTSQTDPLGHTVSFAYDQIGDLLTFTDTRSNTTTYTYDSEGRLLTRTTPLKATESYQYNVDSNLTQYTDRRGQVSTFQYDAPNRLTTETYTDATVTRSYDAQSRLQTVNDSQGGVFGFSYDAAGRLLTQDEPTGVVDYTRDALGRMATRQVVGQAAVTYNYDPLGNLLSAATPKVGVSYKYDARNLPKSLTRTNGVVTTFGFDALGQVLSIVHSNGATALNTIQYTYDAVGKRSVVANDISQALITPEATATVDAANELKTYAKTSYTYDANGNRLTETGTSGTLTYKWDGRNRLQSITDASGNVTSMQYDFARNMLGLAKTSGGATAQQTFVVDSLTNVVSTTAPTGGAYSLLTGLGLDANYASVDGSGNPLFGMSDALGSVTGTTDSGGKLSAQFQYEPYGQMTGVATGAYPFGFTGRVPVLGTVGYFRNRYFDTTMGKFISEDPIGLAGGTNAYSYGNDDPIDFLDPSGLDSNESNSSEPDYSPCSYYTQMCQTTGGSYYCNTGPMMCHNAQYFPPFWGVPTSSLNCVRKCLVREDKKLHQCLPNQTLSDKQINDYHQQCFTECSVGTWRYPGVDPVILNGPRTWGQRVSGFFETIGNFIISPAY